MRAGSILSQHAVLAFLKSFPEYHLLTPSTAEAALSAVPPPRQIEAAAARRRARRAEWTQQQAQRAQQPPQQRNLGSFSSGVSAPIDELCTEIIPKKQALVQCTLLCIHTYANGDDRFLSVARVRSLLHYHERLNSTL